MENADHHIKSGTRPVQQKRSQQTRDALLLALEGLLKQKELSEIKVTEIAQQAGVSAASIYRRFTKKDGLIPALFELTLQRNREWYAQPQVRARVQSLKKNRPTLRLFLLANARLSLQMLKDLHHLARPMFIYARLRPDLIHEEAGALIAMGTKAAKASLEPYHQEIKRRDLDRATTMLIYYFQSIYSDYALFRDRTVFPDVAMDDETFVKEIADFAYGYLTTTEEDY